MKQKQLLEIILPEAMADLPVRIVRGSEHKELVVGLTTLVIPTNNIIGWS